MKKKLLLWIVTIMFTMVLAGCSPKNLLPGFVEEEDDQQKEENHAQPSQEDADDAEGTYVFDNGSVVAGSDLSWPAGSMGDLPIIDGKITAVVNIDTYTAVTCSNMTKAQAESYLAKIKNLGYQGTTWTDDEMLYFGGEKDGNAVMFSFEFESAEGFVSFTVGE